MTMTDSLNETFTQIGYDIKELREPRATAESWIANQNLHIAWSGQSNAGSAGGTAGNGIDDPRVKVKLNNASSYRDSSSSDRPYICTKLALDAAVLSGNDCYATLTFASGTQISAWVDKDGVTGSEWTRLDAACAASYAETGVKINVFGWTQGEADADKAGTGTAESNFYDYYKAVKNLIDLVKAADWSADDIRFLFTEPKRGGSGAYPTDDRKDVVLNMGFDDPLVGAVSSYGLEDAVDSIHFQDDELYTMGERATGVLVSLPSNADRTPLTRWAPVCVPVTFFGGSAGVDGVIPEWASDQGVVISVTATGTGEYKVACNKRISMLICNQHASQSVRRHVMTAPVDDFTWEVRTFRISEELEVPSAEHATMNGLLAVF